MRGEEAQLRLVRVRVGVRVRVRVGVRVRLPLTLTHAPLHRATAAHDDHVALGALGRR